MHCSKLPYRPDLQSAKTKSPFYPSTVLVRHRGGGIETSSRPFLVATVQVLEFSNGKLVLLKTGR